MKLKEKELQRVGDDCDWTELNWQEKDWLQENQLE